MQWFLLFLMIAVSLGEVNLAIGKKVTQICDDSQRTTADKAIDGLADGNDEGQSMAQTCKTEDPWWKLDLGSPFLFNKIQIHNKIDGIHNGLSNFDVILQDSRGVITKQTHFDGSPSWLSPPEVYIWSFSPVSAQYITIKKLGTGTLSLAEVEILQTSVNLALGKTASQISSWYEDGVSLDAANAIDGKNDGFYSGSAVHTNSIENSWWQVDLFTPSTVTQVILYNTDIMKSRISGFHIELIDSDGVVINTSPTFIGTQSVYSWTFQPISSVQIVKVNLPTNYLHFSEIEVFGASTATNIALLASAVLSSTWPNLIASNAIDGNSAGDIISGTIASTAELDNTPKLTINLPTKTSISKVIIYSSCCARKLTGAVLSFYDGANSLLLSVSFSQGLNQLTYSKLTDNVQYIVLTAPVGLQIAEVEVYHSMALM